MTPETAADVLLLADRHCLGGLKQVETEWNIFFFRNLTQSFTLMFMLRRLWGRLLPRRQSTRRAQNSSGRWGRTPPYWQNCFSFNFSILECHIWLVGFPNWLDSGASGSGNLTIMFDFLDWCWRSFFMKYKNLGNSHTLQSHRSNQSFLASKNMMNNGQLKKTGLSHQVWSHEGSTCKKEMTLNSHFSRPAQTDPYMLLHLEYTKEHT